MEFSRKIAVTGIIMPSNWDESGKVIEAALYTNTEEVYTLEHNSLTRALINLLHMKVEIKGQIREHPGGKKSIAAQNYILLDQAFEDDQNTN